MFAVASLAGAILVLAVGIVVGWPHLRFWWLFEPIGANAQGYPEYRHRKTGIVFVSLPGGKFWMGAQKEDPEGPNYDPGAESDEHPVHEVTLSPFLMAKCEVSQAEWEHVMGRKPSDSKGADLPVEQVSWDDCQEFCGKTGLKFPTEAQWEYACRAGTPGPYAGTGKLEDMGWFADNSGAKTHPAGRKQPNQFGLHDMHGNVYEWCADVHNQSFYGTSEAAGLDPVCTSGPGFRVVRGGAFLNNLHDLLRCAYRHRYFPEDRSFVIGFRIVASPPP